MTPADKARDAFTVTTAVYLVDSPSGQCREQTTAQEIAGRYGNDGQNWGQGDTELMDEVEYLAAWSYKEGLRYRGEFADHSAIVIGVDGWEIGFTGRHLRCVCWPEVHPNHEETCEERESWNL